MCKKANLDSYFKWGGKLVKTIGLIEHDKVIIFKYVNPKDSVCPHCQKPIDEHIYMVEDSPSFQNNAEPIETLEV